MFNVKTYTASELLKILNERRLVLTDYTAHDLIMSLADEELRVYRNISHQYHSEYKNDCDICVEDASSFAM